MSTDAIATHDPLEKTVANTVTSSPFWESANTATPSEDSAEPVAKRWSAATIALIIIATGASIFFLRWAEGLLMPLTIGMIASLALNPLVNRLERLHIHRTIAAILVTLTLAGSIGFLIYSIEDDAVRMVQALPATSERLVTALRKLRGTDHKSTVSNVRDAAVALEKAASEAAGTTPTGGPMRVQIETPSFQLRDVLLSGSAGLFTFVAQATIVFFLVFFLLMSGDTLKRRIIRISGKTMAKKKAMLRMLNEIISQVQRALLIIFVTNIALGLLIWIAFLMLGIENAGVWGVISGVLHMVPYFGVAMITGTAGIAGFLQFDSLSRAMLTAGVALGIATIIGMFLTTWLQSRSSKMNPAAVFIGFLFWGWLWGAWGLLLGTAILAGFKAVCDHVNVLKPVAELMGEGD